MPLCSATTTTWLSKLTLPQLRWVAFAIGAPSSGTKPVLTKQIRRELEAFNATATQRGSTVAPSRKFSIVSIDMGIRNLAYAHLVSDSSSIAEAKERAA